MRFATMTPCVAKHGGQSNKMRTTRFLGQVDQRKKRKLKLRLKDLTGYGPEKRSTREIGIAWFGRL
jgi:hypothetical protein